MIFIGQVGDRYTDKLAADYSNLTDSENSVYRFCVTSFPGGEYRVRLVDNPCDDPKRPDVLYKNPTNLARAIANGEGVVLVVRGKSGEDWDSDRLFGIACQATEILKSGDPEYLGGVRAGKLCVVMPHEPFTKQDKLFTYRGKPTRGAAKTLKMGRRILRSMGVDLLLTVFPHDYRREGWVRKKAYRGKEHEVYTDWSDLDQEGLYYVEDWKGFAWAIDPIHLIPEYIRRADIRIDVAVSPDFSASSMCTGIRKDLGIWETGIRKSRSRRDSTRLRTTEQLDPKKIKGRSVGIFDDWILRGTTMKHAIKAVKLAGAKEAHCVSIHGEFVGDAHSELKKLGIKLYATDTVDNPSAVISTTEQIAERLKSLFD